MSISPATSRSITFTRATAAQLDAFVARAVHLGHTPDAAVEMAVGLATRALTSASIVDNSPTSASPVRHAMTTGPEMRKPTKPPNSYLIFRIALSDRLSQEWFGEDNDVPYYKHRDHLTVLWRSLSDEATADYREISMNLHKLFKKANDAYTGLTSAEQLDCDTRSLHARAGRLLAEYAAACKKYSSGRLVTLFKDRHYKKPDMAASAEEVEEPSTKHPREPVSGDEEPLAKRVRVATEAANASLS